MKTKLSLIIPIFLLLFYLSTPYALAQQRTLSNEAVTRVGSPPLLSSPYASVANDLAAAIKTKCGGYVHGSNSNCLQGASLPNTPNPDLAIAEIIMSANAYSCYNNARETCLQCVGFVQAVVAGATGTSLPKAGYPSAKTYLENPPAGYTVISTSDTIQEGDIAVWTNGSAGHIAVVTIVYDATTFDVAEANFDLNGGVDINTTLSTEPGLGGFLRKQ